jgi:hypothetical protein
MIQGVYAMGSVEGFGQAFVRAIDVVRDVSLTERAVDSLMLVSGLEREAGTIPGVPPISN